VLTLAAVAAAFWLLVALPARALGGGDEAAIHAGVAVLMSLIPGVAVILWAGWAFRQDNNQQALAILGASGVRMFVVLGVALILYQGVPFFQRGGFLLWVAGAYLFLLVAEVAMMVKARQTTPTTNTGA
jgi:hypothetical protein